MIHELDISAFRAAFPAFANADVYSDALITIRWGMATGYIQSEDSWAISGTALQAALNLMTAHLMQIGVNIGTNAASTGASGPVQAATVDKVQVTLVPPPVKSQWAWWLSSTPYGNELLALLTVQAAGGFYMGGLPERSAIRKVGGIF